MEKKILALVREADYAHAGEEKAIDIVFKDIPKDTNRFLLDVGCGRGGTAQYIHHGGWGNVVLSVRFIVRYLILLKKIFWAVPWFMPKKD